MLLLLSSNVIGSILKRKVASESFFCKDECQFVLEEDEIDFVEVTLRVS